ncbi:hypothetical protein AVEN_172115-1 [Araneus ventricosus]|uniref:Uncharacterized protein n=1 Tax=Araneus ventricosus TaxID=182803 RepID=A0A4Y2UWP1_ARAVE|nr:hypothetical protein AVEN_172115-1 [Araneus ventricosus]
MIQNDGIQTNSKSKTLCADSNLRPILEASGRLENRKSADRRLMVSHFGAYVNDVRNFSIKMGEKKKGLGATGIDSLQVNAQLNNLCKVTSSTHTTQPFPQW